MFRGPQPLCAAPEGACPFPSHPAGGSAAASPASLRTTQFSSKTRPSGCSPRVAGLHPPGRAARSGAGAVRRRFSAGKGLMGGAEVPHHPPRPALPTPI